MLAMMDMRFWLRLYSFKRPELNASSRQLTVEAPAQSSLRTEIMQSQNHENGEECAIRLVRLATIIKDLARV